MHVPLSHRLSAQTRARPRLWQPSPIELAWVILTCPSRRRPTQTAKSPNFLKCAQANSITASSLPSETASVVSSECLLRPSTERSVSQREWKIWSSYFSSSPKPFNTFAVGASSACEVDGPVVSPVTCSPKSPDRLGGACVIAHAPDLVVATQRSARAVHRG